MISTNLKNFHLEEMNKIELKTIILNNKYYKINNLE